MTTSSSNLSARPIALRFAPPALALSAAVALGGCAMMKPPAQIAPYREHQSRFDQQANAETWKEAFTSWLTYHHDYCAKGESPDCGPAERNEALSKLAALRDWGLAHLDKDVAWTLGHQASVNQASPDLAKTLAPDLIFPKLAAWRAVANAGDDPKARVMKTGKAECVIEGGKYLVESGETMKVRCHFPRPLASWPRTRPDALYVETATANRAYGNYREIMKLTPATRPAASDQVETFEVPASQIVASLQEAYAEGGGKYVGAWAEAKLVHVITNRTGIRTNADGMVEDVYDNALSAETHFYLHL